MYASSAALAADIIDRNNITLSRSAIIAHTEVPGATHTDPGDGWDWDHYMDLIGGEGGVSTGDLLGVVAAEDIYHGERLIDATVWIEETGETVASDGEGYYYFYDLPLGSYTIHADAPGYLQGSCEVSLSPGTNWCSLALLPGEDGETGSGEIDQGDPGSESGAGGVVAGDVTGPPGRAVPIAELGCTTSRSGSGAAALLVALGMLLPGRRRRG